MVDKESKAVVFLCFKTQTKLFQQPSGLCTI
jgi:hypothetical protein